MADSKIKLSLSILESYRGRDKVIRTIQFASMMTAGLLKSSAPINAQKLTTIASQLSLSRVILRLFDDIPMLAYNLFAGGLGQKEKDPLVRLLSFVKGSVDQFFFPIEHIAWAAENKLIDIGSAKWWILSVAMWGISLCLNVFRNFVTFLKGRRQTDKLRKDLIAQQKLSSDGHQPDTSDLRHLEETQYQTKLSILKDFCDLACAIHWFVPGFLWASKLPDSVVGLLGTISSVIGFHIYIKQLQSKQKTK